MILKPSSVSPNNIAKDASEDIIISWKNNGDRSSHYQIKILDNSDDSLIYDTTKLSSFNTFHIVPANTLINGTEYKYQITLWNENNESINSDWIILKCSSVPIGSFTNVSEGSEILNNSYLFQGEYSQAEDIPIRSWTMILYNEVGAIISLSPETFSESIEYNFAGLNNDSSYAIELQVRSQDNLLHSTGKVNFTVRYEVPKVFINLYAENVPEKAANRLQWNVSQIIGSSENATYINNEKLDVTNGKVWFDKGFNISNDFTLKLWIEEVENATFTVNPNASIVSYNINPSDNTIIWFDNSSQSFELPMDITIGNIPPEDTNSMWIHDVNQVPKPLGISMTIDEPPINNIWVDFLGGNDLGKFEILKMKNNQDENISLRYYNNAFHIYKNNNLISSFDVSGEKYYLHLQQKNGELIFHAETII